MIFVGRYERWLKRAKTEDLSEISSLRCMYQTGHDRLGRPVIVFVGKNFPAATIDLDKVMPYGRIGHFNIHVILKEKTYAK